MEPKFQQQGDVLIKPTTLPPGYGFTKQRPNLVLAEGEVTGHAHRVVKADGSPCTEEDAQLFELGDKLVLQILSGDCKVIHEEHKEQAIAPGTYEVSIVRAFDYASQRAFNVAD